MSFLPILEPDSAAMSELCRALSKAAPQLERPGAWPGQQLQWCAEAGVFPWFLPRRWGGEDWGPADLMRGYMELSSACLTTTFVITQRMGACKRIAGSGRDDLAGELLPDLLAGRTFATVGISHLTTSRRHLKEPVLKARETSAGFLLDGYSPWCTGAAQADYLVLGAELSDGRQILVVADTAWEGIEAAEPAELTALTASQTGAVRCEQLEVPRHYVLAGPVENVMQQGQGGSTGGLQTSILAVGLSRAAADYLEQEAQQRSDLAGPAAAIRAEVDQLAKALVGAAESPTTSEPQELRRRANSVVVRSTQAALTAAKGAGYVAGHPVGRWCREAMFFLVWSCPQPVLHANLCELAGVESFG